ncbi:Lipase maturation factor 2 [Nibea albiflora]|uniref:Lipase maturation factor 2 n=1 Tax=Nibea albiflora TaxID=240163 RepID=A0ACB7FF00_NIBAL|nr:Lipase maturation factor 2 [Nibea albiflora]
MGEIILPRRMFLWCMAVIYLAAFVSLYVQIPGLYGNEGLLPARWQLRYSGAALSLGAMLFEALRDSVVFLCLWVLYLSMYQVRLQYMDFFRRDNLLLETGFLCILVAPLTIIRGSRGVREHDRVTFWLIRWLLFRLMFASGVVKLTSRCPTWWGLTALTYHYETQCIPTWLAWFAHQLPVWWQKLSVMATFVIEIAGPLLFFSPLRRLRLGAFYMQVLLQVLIILTGNYNFFNLLTVALCLSLLDDQHVHFWLRKADKITNSDSKLWTWLCYLLELAVWALMIFGAIVFFDLQVDTTKKLVSSRIAFTYHQFNQFLKTVTIPCVWIGVLSLTWEIITSMFRCACVSGFLKRFCGTVQWTVFAAATAAMFTISLVPFTYIEFDSNARLWPGVRQAYDLVDRYQLVNSYGLFRRMTGVSGRPEVVIEGSNDGVSWTEIEFMYKPGNLSAPPPVLTPHQPRLDWQMWFAALGPHTQAPWFTNLMYRLLQGKRDVIELIQTDVSQYPFHKQPPAYLRAHRYRYWFTETKADGSYPQRWWRRVYDEEFYPTVHLGSTFLDSMVTQYGLKDKLPANRRVSNKPVAVAVRWVRSQVRGVPAHILIWTLMGCGITICLLQGLQSRKKCTTVSDHAENVPDGSSDHCGKSGDPQAAKEVEEEDGEGSEDEVEQGKGEETDTEKEDEAQDEEEDEEEEDEKTENVRKRRP